MWKTALAEAVTVQPDAVRSMTGADADRTGAPRTERLRLADNLAAVEDSGPLRSDGSGTVHDGSAAPRLGRPLVEDEVGDAEAAILVLHEAVAALTHGTPEDGTYLPADGARLPAAAELSDAVHEAPATA